MGVVDYEPSDGGVDCEPFDSLAKVLGKTQVLELKIVETDYNNNEEYALFLRHPFTWKPAEVYRSSIPWTLI